MLKTALCLLLPVCGLLAQTVETIPFRAVLSPRNEVPAITNLNASGAATILAHVVRDASGRIVSGSVDFLVNYSFPSGITVTGLHIHRGSAGVNGPVVIGAIGGADGPAVEDASGTAGAQRQSQVMPASETALEALRGLVENPEGYYANLHTSDNPGGAIRGQLQPARERVLMGLMSPSNEVPAIAGLDASGVGTIHVLVTEDGSGNVTSAEVTFDVTYRFPSDVTFTGLHIHEGDAGVNGSVTINTGLRSEPSAAGGSGNLRYTVEVPVSNAAALRTVYGLLNNPGGYYVNLHTTVNTGGAIRAQLRSTDRDSFQVPLSPANEVPPVTTVNATGAAEVVVNALRNNDGSVAAGTVMFRVNHRFPQEVEFTGLHIHDAQAGQNGPVTIDSGISGTRSVTSGTGFGGINRFVTVTAANAVASLNSVLTNPERHYLNLHSRVNPSGVIRGQLLPANNAAPFLGDILSAVSEPSLKTVAPAGLMTVFGANIAKVPADLVHLDGPEMPTSVNGTSVTVGGAAAPMVLLGTNFVVVQVPVEVQPGMREVAVRNANGSSATVQVLVAQQAPAIYFDGSGAIAFRAAGGALIRPDNPARAGEQLAFLMTGLGQTAPPLATGVQAPALPLRQAAPMTMTVGGRAVQVAGAAAVPGFLGQYLALVMLPADLPAGAHPVVARMGDAVSNSVTLPVR